MSKHPLRHFCPARQSLLSDALGCDPAYMRTLQQAPSKSQARLGQEGFSLIWRPEGDLADLFDERFTWHGELNGRFQTPETSGFAAIEPGTGRVEATGEAGLLYGALEFLERCDVRQRLPVRPLEVTRTPAMPLRSACLQLMKKGDYLLPITAEQFPWFFDRAWWNRYLDTLLRHRFNAVTLWNFHPFPYFCAIEGHPEVREIDDEEQAANAEHLRWLIAAAKQRGISLLWHFYNIYVCPSFARAHGLNTLHNQFTPQQEKQVFAYIRHSVRSLANAFPEVGFVACAGEGVPAGKAERFVADVLVAALNETSHRPRLVVRQWSSLSASRFEREVVGRYDALWAMFKHNAEQIAGTVPDARIADWIATGVPMVVNFHMLSEIGPFRWAPPSYIREMCLHYKAMGVQGVHVYPHWAWRTPTVGDLNFDGDELDRDWLYHAAWGRYSFDPVRDGDEEHRHWVRQARRRGVPADQAEALIAAYDHSGAALPRLQQHLWASFDNHSVMSAGFTLGQMRFGRSMHGRKIIRTDRQEDVLPLRQQLKGKSPIEDDYAFEASLARSEQDLQAALGPLESQSLSPGSEPERLRADLIGQREAITYWRQKVKVAELLMRFDRKPDHSLLHEAVERLQQTLKVYRAYRDHCEQYYEGITDVPPLFPFHNYTTARLPVTWSDCLAVFEQEFRNVQTFAQAIERNAGWSLVHRFGMNADDPRATLERRLVDRPGLWLTGDPDFLPWHDRQLEHMHELVLLPCPEGPRPEISVLSDTALLRRWVDAGGQLTVLTLPDRAWVEHVTLAGVLECEPATLDPRTVEVDASRHLTMPALAPWRWHHQHDGRGIHGDLTLGQGRITFLALASSEDGALDTLMAHGKAQTA